MPRITKPRQDEPIRLVTTKSGDHRYEVVLTVSEPGQPRRQTRKRYRALKDARAAVDETRDKVRKHQFLARNSMTLKALATMWATSRTDIRKVSLQGYLQALAFILQAHGDLPVQQITRPMVEGWVADWPTTGGVRGKGIGHRSIVYSLLALKLVLAYGVEVGVLSRNPAEGVKPPRARAVDRRDMPKWSTRQLKKFVKVADQDAWAAAWRLTASGLRRSEVLGLDWSHVDLDAGTVEVASSRVKVGTTLETELDDVKSPASARVVPVESMWPGSVKLLKAEWLRQGRPETGLVVRDAAGQPPHPDTFGDVFRGLSRAAGNPEVGIHSVRRTIASSLHEQGVSPAAAARLLGHTVQVHLAYYVKADDDQVTAAADRFAKVFGGSGERVS